MAPDQKVHLERKPNYGFPDELWCQLLVLFIWPNNIWELCTCTYGMTLFVFFCTGLRNVDQYVSQLARYIEDNEPALVVARADRLVQ